MGKLDGKVAIVTGGGSGFGKGACLLFAAEGARVAVADVDAEAGQAVAGEVKSAGGEAIFVKTDISKDADAEALIAKTVAAFGGLHVLYNNAGILGSRGVYLTDFDDKVAERLISVNFMGVYYPTKRALPAMIRSGGGSIISTGSESAFQGNTGFSVYSATKAAVLAFSRVVAMEYVDKGIRANTVSPGAGRTPMHADLMDGKSDLFERVENLIPMKRAAEPIDVAKAALFFASDRFEIRHRRQSHGRWRLDGQGVFLIGEAPNEVSRLRQCSKMQGGKQNAETVYRGSLRALSARRRGCPGGEPAGFHSGGGVGQDKDAHRSGGGQLAPVQGACGQAGRHPLQGARSQAVDG